MRSRPVTERARTAPVSARAITTNGVARLPDTSELPSISPLAA